MNYDADRLNGGDPAFSPGIVRAKNLFYWRAPKADIKAGYEAKSIRLPGQAGDGRDLERAALCRDHWRALLRWRDGADRVKVSPTSWQYVIARYRNDDISPFQDIKPNTRETYRPQLAKWEAAIGSVEVADTDFPTIKRWQKAMQDKGRSAHYIRSMFAMLRIITSYAVMLKVPGAGDVRDILSEMRFAAPKARTVSPTADQIEAIIAAADNAGDAPFALGLSLQWWLALRAADVRGNWLEGRWADGLTWDMVDLKALTITKVPSKTAAKMTEALTWDLSLLPEIVARLEAVPKDQRVGPVVKMKNGQPYKRRYWTERFEKHRAAAGVPDHVWMMDTRAGAINHAKQMGASPIQMQHQANHANLSTTDRYIRERSDAVNNVIKMRRG